MESFYRTLKVELVYWENYETRDHARQSIGDYIEHYYNRRRRHSAIDYRCPVDYELAV